MDNDRDSAPGDTGALNALDTPRVSSDEARRIVADLLISLAMNDARVEFKIASFFGAPEHPVWLVHAGSDANRLGASILFAVCPETGRVLFSGLLGE